MKTDDVPKDWYIFKSRDEWRDWLKASHTTETSAWVQIRKSRSMVPGISLSEAVEEAICFGWIDGKMYSLDSDRYLLRMSPRKPGSLWSMINRRRAEALMAEERMTEAGMASIRAARARGLWQTAYSSKASPAIPDDLAAALAAEPLAEKNFSIWTNSLKLRAVAWVEQSKRPATRADRIARVVRSARDKQAMF